MRIPPMRLCAAEEFWMWYSFALLSSKRIPKSQNYFVSLPTYSQGKLSVTTAAHRAFKSREVTVPRQIKQLHDGCKVFSSPVPLVPFILFSQLTASR